MHDIEEIHSKHLVCEQAVSEHSTRVSGQRIYSLHLHMRAAPGSGARAGEPPLVAARTPFWLCLLRTDPGDVGSASHPDWHLHPAGALQSVCRIMDAAWNRVLPSEVRPQV